MTLTDFLLARIAEDEAGAKSAPNSDPVPWSVRQESDVDYSVRNQHGFALDGKALSVATSQHIARHDPARVLAECESKRRIVELHPGATVDDECPGCHAWLDGDWVTGPGELCPVLAALALPYADHPDYREEWRA